MSHFSTITTNPNWLKFTGFVEGTPGQINVYFNFWYSLIYKIYEVFKIVDIFSPWIAFYVDCKCMKLIELV